MTTSTPTLDHAAYAAELATRSQKASRALCRLSGGVRTALLNRIADLLVERAPEILEANALDMSAAAQQKLAGAMVDRLKLSEARIGGMAASVRQIAEQVDPVGQIIEGQVRPNGLRIEKTRVPLGVVLFIYESRPNVTSDAAALCIKSANALILRGGKEALHSNSAITRIIRQAITEASVDPDILQIVENPDRQILSHLLKQEGVIDLVIPRGGEGLIRMVAEQSRIPVIKHYTGNCHVYIDRHADALAPGVVRDICVNAKVQRPGVCNAAETLLVHKDAPGLLREACGALMENGVEIRACPRTAALLGPGVKGLKAAVEQDWATEYLEKIIAVRVVDSLQQAIDHINQYGSRHTDAILTGDLASADAFVQQVDSASVMVNASTRFADGGEYGLGAEIGISTDKLHARGPMGAADMTTYKWIVRGQGQVRS